MIYYGIRQVPETPDTLSAAITLIGFSAAALGITEFMFGDKNKKFTMQEVFTSLLIIVGILVAITIMLPQLTFGQNVFMKQALLLVGGN